MPFGVLNAVVAFQETITQFVEETFVGLVKCDCCREKTSTSTT